MGMISCCSVYRLRHLQRKNFAVRIIFLLSLLTILTGCTRQWTIDQTLSEAAEHVATCPDSTWQLLERIPDAPNGTPENRAYYVLLQAQSAWRLYKEMPSDTLLSSAVDFFRKSEKQPELCTAIYYRAMPLYERGQQQQALPLLLEGVAMAEELADDSLRSKYYESLCVLNSQAECNELYLTYARKFLEHSLKIDNVEYTVRALNHVSMAYSHLGQKDSSLYYQLRTDSILHLTNPADQACTLTNLAIDFLSQNDTTKAKQYLLRSLDVMPREHTCKVLADILANEGDTAKAKEYWAVALNSDDNALRLSTLRSMLSCQIKYGKNQQAQETYMHIIALQDSISRQSEQQQIREIQYKYRQEVLSNHYNRIVIYSLSALLLTVFVLTIFGYYHRKKVQKITNVVKQNIHQVAVLQDEISQLSSDGTKKEKKIDSLQKEVRVLQQSIGERLGKGIRVYDQLRNGGILSQQDPDNEPCLAEFYSLYRSETYNEWLEKYESLSPRLITFLILMDMGFDEERIAEVLSVTAGSIRTTKSRLRQKERR